MTSDVLRTPPQNTGELAEYKYGTQGLVSPESLVGSGLLKDPEIGVK